MKYHPDSNPDDEEAEAKYQEVQDAYNRLSAISEVIKKFKPTIGPPPGFGLAQR